MTTDDKTKLTKALIEYLVADPAACEIQVSVSKSTEGIESMNILVKDELDNITTTIWQEFREGEKVITTMPGWAEFKVS